MTILQTVSRAFVSWVSLGVTQEEGALRRHMTMTNVLVTLISLLCIPFAVGFALYDFQGLWIPIAVIGVSAFLFQLTLYLNTVNIYAAGIYNLLLWIGFATSLCYFFGRESGVHFFLLAGATSAISIFGVRQNPLSVLSISLGMVLFFYVDTNITQPAPFLDLTPAFLMVMYFVTICVSFLVIFCMVFYAFWQAHRAETLLQQEYEYSEALLKNMLPAAIATQLKRNPGQTIADDHDSVTILFADIVDFTPRASDQTATEVVQFLNRLFTRFDKLADKHGLEKIKTLGDAFMVAGGMPDPQDDHADRTARMALDMVQVAREFSEETGEKVELRIGIHTGPAVAGVIGTQKPFYDVWGDTVNTAARLENHGTNGKIQITSETKELLEGKFAFSARGKMAIKGKGLLDLWYLDEMSEDEEDSDPAKAAE